MKSNCFGIAAFLFAAAILSPNRAGAQQQLNIPVSQMGDYMCVVPASPSSSGSYYQSTSGTPFFGAAGNYTNDAETYSNMFCVLNLSQIPAGDTITSASVYFGNVTPLDSPENIEMLEPTVPESLILSATSQSDLETVYSGLANGPELAGNPSFDPYGTITFGDSTNFLNLLNANIGNVVAISFIANEGRVDTLYEGPTVTVGVVPEPSTWALATLSVVGLIGWRRLRKNGML